VKIASIVRGRSSARRTDGRGVSPTVGIVLMIALTVCLGTVVAVGVGTWSPGSSPPTAAFELSADGDRSSITIEHVAGDAVDVRALSVTIAIDGTELSAQPPVPFVGASGFDGAPDGPFNSRADPEWTAGERAGVAVAETNAPELAAGDSVTVTLTVDGRRVAELETTAT
jgi:FlaG/FlaF family flagellin (archaellin)